VSKSRPWATTVTGPACCNRAPAAAAAVLAKQAQSLARQRGYRLLEGQALTVLAAVHLGQDELIEAVDLARPAEPLVARYPPVAALTARELEIARMAGTRNEQP